MRDAGDLVVDERMVMVGGAGAGAGGVSCVLWGSGGRGTEGQTHRRQGRVRVGTGPYGIERANRRAAHRWMDG